MTPRVRTFRGLLGRASHTERRVGRLGVVVIDPASELRQDRLGILETRPRLWHRLFGGPASESGKLPYGDRPTERAPAAGRVLMLPTLWTMPDEPECAQRDP